MCWIPSHLKCCLHPGQACPSFCVPPVNPLPHFSLASLKYHVSFPLSFFLMLLLPTSPVWLLPLQKLHSSKLSCLCLHGHSSKSGTMSGATSRSPMNSIGCSLGQGFNQTELAGKTGQRFSGSNRCGLGHTSAKFSVNNILLGSPGM